MAYFNTNFINDFELFLNSESIEYKKDGNLYAFENLFSIELLPATCEPCNIANIDGRNTLFLYEDRWYNCASIVKGSILSRLGLQDSIFARKCEIISYTPEQKYKNVDIKKSLESFLNEYHTYSNAKAMYYYALIYGGKIVAAASFSAPRPMQRVMDNSIIISKSYEWVRYASLFGVRVVGGMGKLLNAFEKDIASKLEAYDIMSYSDNEWSNGDSYLKLGFNYVGDRAPVEFAILKESYKRVAINKLGVYKQKAPTVEELYRIHNLGSKKFIKFSATVL